MVLLVTFGIPELSCYLRFPVSPGYVRDVSARSVPVLAYYYIWFDSDSWGRAKIDYPLLGRYSSDDPDVMRQHVRWAKEAGIDGFLVSWKGANKLNRRLEQLVRIAEEEDFKLAINYESLDFKRQPLPVSQIDADLNYFIDRYAGNPVFDIFGKSLVVWSGTSTFPVDEIRKLIQNKRDHVLILASEKNVKGYQRLATLVDGNAYYWSSVNPETHPGYAEKLMAMGQAVHKNEGLWIAPAAPGFDSRLLGGTTAIGRQGGETLRKEMEAALRSAPDAIGLISWNEFSENSHIEPSDIYGKRYLEVLSETQATAPVTK
ncbi:MAG TPA: endo-1,3-alpha-glucanase family glycosylhydrolase [Anaerolineales bacterium]|nr:endo-1,3-alpha-glucanase family glycosylhydrolase [Anaerolineales bacterium]